RGSLAYTKLAQRVRELGDLCLQLGVRNRATRVGRFPLPVERHAITVARLDMAVHTVVADIQSPTQEPLGVRRIPLFQLRERFEPRHPLAPLGFPELVRITLINLGAGVRLCDELRRRWI